MGAVLCSRRNFVLNAQAFWITPKLEERASL